MSEKMLEELVVQAKALGFNYVGIYIPNKETDEVIAFTFSKSEAYLNKVQEIEETSNK